MESPKDKVLLLAHNPAVSASVRNYLISKYQVETATSTSMADFLLQEWEPKICIIEDFADFVSWIPKLKSQKAFARLGLIVVASGHHHNEEKAFKFGCDHWIHLDGSLDRIGWRVNSLLRHYGQGAAPSHLKAVPNSPTEDAALEIEDLKIYPKDFLVKRQGTVVNISPTQFKLLSTFVSHPDQLLSREWIKSHVWNDSEISLRSIDAHISKLRKALPELDRYLMNIYGKGYIFSRSKQAAA